MLSRELYRYLRLTPCCEWPQTGLTKCDEIFSNVEEGHKFYKQLGTRTKTLCTTISDYCQTRNMEARNLLVEMQRSNPGQQLASTSAPCTLRYHLHDTPPSHILYIHPDDPSRVIAGLAFLCVSIMTSSHVVVLLCSFAGVARCSASHVYNTSGLWRSSSSRIWRPGGIPLPGAHLRLSS